MANVLVSTIMANARLLADERATAFITDAEVLRLTNLAFAEHRDLLIQAQGPHNYEGVVELGTTAGTDFVAMPERFYRLLSVHQSWNSTKTDLEEIPQLGNIADRDLYINEGQPWAKGSYKCCMLGGLYVNEDLGTPKLYLFPTPPTQSSVTKPLIVRYVTDHEDFTSGDAPFIINGHDRMISLRVAMDLRNIQGLPTTFLQKQYEADRSRIEESIMNRSNEPSKIRDVEPRRHKRRYPGVF